MDELTRAAINFEIKADAFRRMTGYPAPGKDMPAAAYVDERQEGARMGAWSVWLSVYGECMDAVLAAIEEMYPGVFDG